jgi:hypothetical protein
MDRPRVEGAWCLSIGDRSAVGVEEHVPMCSAGAHSGTGRQHIHILGHYTVLHRVV